MWMGGTFGAMRMHDYKMHKNVVLPQADLLWIDQSSIFTTGVAPWLFNLSVDPHEQYAVGHRLNAWTATMGAEMNEHGATFVKYPPKKVGLE